MTFADLDLPLSIRSTRVDPLSEFFVPVLSKAHSYDVAVGFFSSGWIRDAAEGIAGFAANGGHARWIISPHISKADYDVLRNPAGVLAENKIDEIIVQSVAKLLSVLQEDTLTVLAWMIRDKVMEFRVGVPKNELSGMLHAKMGIFRDEEENTIGFSGSYNLTAHAATNWETLEIFCGWRSDEARQRIALMAGDFEDMWKGQDSNLAVFIPSDRALKAFIEHTERTTRPWIAPAKPSQKITTPERYLQNGELRDYQKSAINEWFSSNGRGVLSMATGSGKTVTALAAAARLVNFALQKPSKIIVLVIVPYQHLADQWASEARDFGFDPIVCFGGVKRWLQSAQRRMTELAAIETGQELFVAVNNTFAGEAFQTLIRGKDRNILLIADEMHHLGAFEYRRLLPEEVRFRLGLSATPVRHGDEEGTRSLVHYFGRTVFTFNLAQAIDRGFLCRYYYHPVLCPLNDEEMGEYKDFSNRIARVYSARADPDNDPGDQLKALLIARARLIGRVESKVERLRELLQERKESTHNLIYCGDARENDERQVDRVLRVVGHDVGMRTAKFTSGENATERQVLLDRFTTGELQALIAIRCLDEGVDVPATATAFILASSTNPRQYIQRRGRVLRRAPGKDTATIYDFIAVPDLEELARTDAHALQTERGLLKRELERANEFAELAINPGRALEELRKIKIRLHLMEV